MKKLLFMPIMLTALLIASGCTDSSVENLEADYFDISYGESIYEGSGRISKETIQSLVEAYNHIEYSGQTNQQLNYKKAITITFVEDDQISGILVIDDKGVFQLSDGAKNYQIEPDNAIYEQAMKIYNDLDLQS